MIEAEVRPAGIQDIEGILHCLHAAFAPYREQYTPAAFLDTVMDVSTLERRMQTMHVIVATVSNEIVGTVAGAACEGGEGHLRGMAALRQQQGTGVATRLLSAIEGWLKSKGCDHVTLDTTLPLLPAMRFYEKNGYARTARVRDFFGMKLIEYRKNL